MRHFLAAALMVGSAFATQAVSANTGSTAVQNGEDKRITVRIGRGGRWGGSRWGTRYCVARNWRGQTFVGNRTWGYRNSMWEARRSALNRCERYSRGSCYIAYCN